MNKKSIKENFRKYFPDIPVLRKMFTKGQIFLLKHYLLPEKETLLGEKRLEKKREIVEKYRRKWPKYLSKAEKTARIVLRDAPCYQQANNLDDIITEMLFCLLAYGFAPDEFCYFGLLDKTVNERREYVSQVYRTRFKFSVNQFDDLTFSDKYRAYLCLKKHYGREAVALNEQADYNVFNDFVLKYPVFVKKQVDLSCGKSVELIDANQYDDKKALFDSLISGGKVILEEKIVQSEQMAAFNLSSVNTVRCFSFNTKKGIIVPFCFLRTGRKGSFVDNAGSGGIFAALDSKSGIVIAEGIDELGSRYTNHPDSGVKYVGFQIPEWDDAISLCKSAAKEITKNKYIGWDLAHTENGWKIVEGNTNAQLVHQGSLQKGLKPELDAIISSMELIVKNF